MQSKPNIFYIPVNVNFPVHFPVVLWSIQPNKGLPLAGLYRPTNVPRTISVSIQGKFLTISRYYIGLIHYCTNIVLLHVY